MTVPRWIAAPKVAGALFALAVLLAATAYRSPASQSELRGRLHLIWDGEPTSGNPDGLRAYLVEDDGRATSLLLDFGPRTQEYLAWNQRRVETQVDALPPDRTGERRARLLTIRPLPSAAAVASTPEGVARLDFITVLCRFADDPPEPVAPDRIARVVGPEYPGMRQYYDELSSDSQIMAGNDVTAVWYDLPTSRSHYVQGSGTAHDALVTDCTRAAEADVDFPSYHGINLQFGAALSTRSTPPYDVLSFGGSWTLTLNGLTRVWGVTWMSLGHAENYVVYAHEMGHALGWPHSLTGFSLRVDSAVPHGFALTITRGWQLDLTVTGNGAIRAAAGGIDCAGSCTRVFTSRGTAVTLRAEPAVGQVFGGWTGACHKTGPCSLTMHGARSVGATFEAKRALAQEAVLDRLFGRPNALTPDDLRFLDLLGNRNDRFDIGDVLVWLIDTRALSVSASLTDVLSLPRRGRAR